MPLRPVPFPDAAEAESSAPRARRFGTTQSLRAANRRAQGRAGRRGRTPVRAPGDGGAAPVWARRKAWKKRLRIVDAFVIGAFRLDG